MSMYNNIIRFALLGRSSSRHTNSAKAFIVLLNIDAHNSELGVTHVLGKVRHGTLALAVLLSTVQSLVVVHSLVIA